MADLEMRCVCRVDDSAVVAFCLFLSRYQSVGGVNVGSRDLFLVQCVDVKLFLADTLSS